MNKFILIIILSISSFAIAEQNNKDRVALLKTRGGVVDKPIATNETIISLIDNREKKDDKLLNFRHDLERKLHFVTLLNSKPDNASIKLVLTDNAEFILNLDKKIAFVPCGENQEVTNARLYQALLAIFSTQSDILTQDGLMMTYRAATNLKLAKKRRTTYLQAVKEGWAPAPTNDIQRAVWDKVKADMAVEKK